MGKHITHTQDSIVVYVLNSEKEQIRKTAQIAKKSMSRYLLDLHLKHKPHDWSLGPPEPPRPKTLTLWDKQGESLMAIRIRVIKNITVALCAAKTIAGKGDIYLDDNIHHALSTKFCMDLTREGFLKVDLTDDNIKKLILKEEKNLC